MFFCHFGSLSADEFHGKHYFCTVKENILKKTHTRIIPYDHARRNQRIRRGTYRFVANEIKRVTDPIYCQEGIKIVDARNHIFRLSDTLRTDEAEDTYALSDLCIVDEDMQTVPHRQRMYRIARNYWNG